MNPINGLIDQAASKCEPANDSALAKRMHVSRSAVSLWRKGGTISEKHLTALIVLADVDEVTALRVLEAQAETKPQKAVWTALLHRLGATTALVLCAIGFSGAVPGKAYAVSVSQSAEGSQNGSMSIMSKHFPGDWGWWLSDRSISVVSTAISQGASTALVLRLRGPADVSPPAGI